jgi:phenylacetate-CoA ligase
MPTDRSILASLALLAGARGLPGMRIALGLLDRTERWSAAELLRHQLLRLEQLLDHARTSVPLYRSRLSGCSSTNLSLDRLRDLPILARSDLLDHYDELLSENPPALHAVVRETHSSGSTGRPIAARIDGAGARINQLLSLRDHRWHGRDLSAKAAGIRAIVEGASAPLGRHDPRWSVVPDSGPLGLLDAHTPVKAQLDWLQREGPAYLATYASNAAALVEEAERSDVRLPSLRELGTFGGVLRDGLREAARRVWNVPVVDSYSMVELGYLALQCPASQHYHVQSESVLVELLRDDGSPCEEGEIGRVVATALHAFAMPLIRYETGDYAVAGGPCVCGRSLPVIERILGRERNMMVLASGDVLWPRYGANVLGEIFGLRQFRMIQTEIGRLTLEVVRSGPLDADEGGRLRDMILGILGHRVELEIRYVDEIPRSPGGKFEDFVCLVERPGLTPRSG